jgi:hypothetical protein
VYILGVAKYLMVSSERAVAAGLQFPAAKRKYLLGTERDKATMFIGT